MAENTPPLLHVLPKSSVQLHDEVIGSGGYSKVWRATYTGMLGQKLPVAAKKVLSPSDKEVLMIQKMNHKHIIKFYGIWEKDDETYIIMELADRGDLRSFLNKSRKQRQQLTMECIFKWIYEAACALQYFKSLKISHRDVKSLNFLIMADYTLKLGDLGLATPLSTTRMTPQRSGTCCWTAPEVFQEELRSPRSDIFSFGIMMWEIITTCAPYDDLGSNFQVMNAVCEGKRPAIPDGCPDVLKNLVTSCWDGDRRHRPDIDTVCQMLLPYQCATVSMYVEPLPSTGSRVWQASDVQGASADLYDTATQYVEAVACTELPEAEANLGIKEMSSSQQTPGQHMEIESEHPFAEPHGQTRAKAHGSKRFATAQSPLQGFSQPLQYYKMRNKPHGICVIINNMDFEQARREKHADFRDRRGSEIDADKLKKVFENLDYEVKTFTNLIASNMYDRLDKMRQQDHSSFDCLICCILTHGSNGKIYGCDGTPIPILKLTSLFTADICNTLSGKPKLFIFESCQGTKRQGTTTEHDGITLKESIPNESDFVLGYATVPGHVAYRHTKERSWYVKALVNTCTLEACKSRDVLTLLTLVNKSLSTCEDEEGNKQTASVFNTLRKTMYLCAYNDDSGRDYSTSP